VDGGQLNQAGWADDRTLALGLMIQFFGTNMGLGSQVELMTIMGMSSSVGAYWTFAMALVLVAGI
jgi:hypothetical protein